jgi:hypothetical protein
MVDPVSLGVMAAVGMAGTAAGGLIGGLGAKESGDAAAGASTYKAGVALLNKQVADQNAAWALQAGDTQAEVKGLQEGQKIGMEKVVQSASGLDVNTGTAAKVREDMGTAALFDQNVIRWDSSKTAYGYEVKAASDTAESRLDLMAADQYRTAGDIGELTSFINAGSSVASKWSQGKMAGLFQTG